MTSLRDVERALIHTMSQLHELQHMVVTVPAERDSDGLRHVITHEAAQALAALRRAEEQLRARAPPTAHERIRPSDDAEVVYNQHVEEQDQDAYNYDDDYEGYPEWSELSEAEQDVWRAQAAATIADHEQRVRERDERIATARRNWTTHGYDAIVAAATSTP
jgi:hypothetical protein